MAFSHAKGKTAGTLKFMFSKKATKIDEILTVTLTLFVKSTVKILSIFVAFLENTNFIFLLQLLNVKFTTEAKSLINEAHFSS